MAMIWEILKKLFTLNPGDMTAMLPGESMVELNRLVEMAVIVTVALLLGGVIALVYSRTQRHEPVAGNFVMTLVLLPVIVSILVIMTADLIARAFTLAGIFALVRFRSPPADPKDLCSVLFCVGVGLGMGLGVAQYASLAALVYVLVMVIAWIIKGLPIASTRRCTLRVAVPEDMCWEQTFEEIIKKYARRVALQRIRTMEMGSYFELRYDVTLPGNLSPKAMLDEIRAHNGNLTVVLTNFADYTYGMEYMVR